MVVEQLQVVTHVLHMQLVMVVHRLLAQQTLLKELAVVLAVELYQVVELVQLVVGVLLMQVVVVVRLLAKQVLLQELIVVLVVLATI